MYWNGFGRDSLVEHTAQCDTINIAGMNTKADYSPREMIHDDEHPMGSQAVSSAGCRQQLLLRRQVPEVWQS